jgi:hypothetical protein
VGFGKPSRIFDVKATASGNFIVKHGARCTPTLVHPVMTSGENFWFHSPEWDDKNVYLVSSGEGSKNACDVPVM